MTPLKTHCKNTASSHYMKPRIHYDEIRKVYLQVFVMSSTGYHAVHLADVSGLQASEVCTPHPSRSSVTKIYMCHIWGMQEPRSRSRTSKPFARKQFTTIGSDFCMEIWQCAVFFKDHGTIIVFLQLWHQA
jgi:hypothetical protein